MKKISTMQVFGNEIFKEHVFPANCRFLTSYTFSHSIDDLSQEIPGIFVFRSLPQYLHPSVDRGSSDFNIRHSLNGAVIAALPAQRRGVASILFGNWSANGIFFARSALPTNIVDPSNLDLRPNYVRGQLLYLYGRDTPIDDARGRMWAFRESLCSVLLANIRDVGAPLPHFSARGNGEDTAVDF